jgi:hypothetical protein
MSVHLDLYVVVIAAAQAPFTSLHTNQQPDIEEDGPYLL